MIKKKVHIDVYKLYNAMLEKEEQVPATYDEFIQILGCDILGEGEVMTCDFPYMKDCFEGNLNNHMKVLADLMQRIQEFISFYYNIYDEVIYLERGEDEE